MNNNCRYNKVGIEISIDDSYNDYISGHSITIWKHNLKHYERVFYINKSNIKRFGFNIAKYDKRK
jgi:hypothetical protein